MWPCVTFFPWTQIFSPKFYLKTTNCANRSFRSYTHFLKHAYGSNCSSYQIVPNVKSLTPEKIAIEHTFYSEKAPCNQKYPRHNSRLLAFRPLLSKKDHREFIIIH